MGDSPNDEIALNVNLKRVSIFGGSIGSASSVEYPGYWSVGTSGGSRIRELESRIMKAIGSSTVYPGYRSVSRGISSLSFMGASLLRFSNSCNDFLLSVIPSALTSRRLIEATLKGGAMDSARMRPNAVSSSSKQVFEGVSPSLL